MPLPGWSQRASKTTEPGKMKQVSRNQAKINRAVSKRTQWLFVNYPLCILCGHLIVKGADPVHLIRRSNAIPDYDRFQIQTLDLNLWLGHRDCHDIFDNKPEEAMLLPQFDLVMALIQQMSPAAYNELNTNVYNQLRVEPENHDQ